MLEAIVERIPPPEGEPEAPPRALIFDSEFDQYRGVVAYVRMVDGTFAKGEPIAAMQAGTEAEIDEIGFFAPEMRAGAGMSAGEVGYVITGIKDVSKLRVGDTLTSRGARPAAEALPGYREVQPMVFCGLFPIDTDRYEDLRDALDRLALNDAALSYEPETSRGARLRLSLRLPRPAAHGHRARAPRARVRPRAARDDPQRPLRGPLLDGGEAVEVHTPTEMPDPATIEEIRRALHPRHDHHPVRLRRRGDGALPGAPRHPRRHALPLAGARAAPLRPAAGRDRARLLRPAQVPHARLRLARLRADRHRASDLVKLDVLLAGDRWTRSR